MKFLKIIRKHKLSILVIACIVIGCAGIFSISTLGKKVSKVSQLSSNKTENNQTSNNNNLKNRSVNVPTIDLRDNAYTIQEEKDRKDSEKKNKVQNIDNTTNNNTIKNNRPTKKDIQKKSEPKPKVSNNNKLVNPEVTKDSEDNKPNKPNKPEDNSNNQEKPSNKDEELIDVPGFGPSKPTESQGDNGYASEEDWNHVSGSM